MFLQMSELHRQLLAISQPKIEAFEHSLEEGLYLSIDGSIYQYGSV